MPFWFDKDFHPPVKGPLWGPEKLGQRREGRWAPRDSWEGTCKKQESRSHGPRSRGVGVAHDVETLEAKEE